MNEKLVNLSNDLLKELRYAEVMKKHWSDPLVCITSNKIETVNRSEGNGHFTTPIPYGVKDEITYIMSTYWTKRYQMLAELFENLNESTLDSTVFTIETERRY